MFSYEKFDVFNEIVSSLSGENMLTYSPLLREGFQFCLEKARKVRDIETEQKLVLSGVDKTQYPVKRKIIKVGYFHNRDFLRNIINALEAQEVTVEKLALIPSQLKKIMSNKQREEIDYFDHHLRTHFECNIREKLEERFHFANTMIPQYYQLLKNSGIDALLLRVYYGLNYFPVIFACKMLGITVIDVQHGINGFKHPAYSGFKPSEVNSPFLPDIFWTWSEMATKMLMHDSALALTAIIVEGGNPVFSDATEDNFSGKTAKKTKGTRILYTHQPQSKGIPVPVEAIKKLHKIKNQKVIIRPHPLHIEEAQEAQKILKKSGVNCTIEDSKKTSINQSLAKASVHVTHSSTCALDALNLGIPSVYCSEYIGDVENQFSTGLLFREKDIDNNSLTRDAKKAIDFSMGSSEKIYAGITGLLASTNSETS